MINMVLNDMKKEKINCSSCGLNFINKEHYLEHIRKKHLADYFNLDWTKIKDERRYFTKSVKDLPDSKANKAVLMCQLLIY